MRSYLFGVFKPHPAEILGLNGIRSIAYFMVIYSHFYRSYEALGVVNPRQWANNFLMNGSLCMDAFFVLSGFLIGGQLFREVREKGHLEFRKFFVKRVLRIFPPYYIFLILQYVVLTSIAGATTDARLQNEIHAGLDRIVFDFAYLTDYFRGIMVHGWSLSVEEKFYLLLPFSLLLLQKIKRPSMQLSVLGALFFVPMLIRIGTFYSLAHHGVITFEQYNQYFYYPFHSRLDSLVLGVLFAGFYSHYPERIKRYLTSNLSSIIAGLGTAVLLLIMFLTNEKEPGLFTASMRLTVAALAWLAIILLCFKENSVARKFLSFRPFVPIARLSYCGYIIHLLLLGVIAGKIVGQQAVTYTQIAIWTIPIGLIIMGFAYLYYLFAERPFLYLKEKLFGRRPAVDRLETRQSGDAATA